MEDNINEMEITKAEGAALEVRPIETITAEILYLKQRTGEDILEIGKRLIEAKAQLGHGDWETWLAEKVEFTDRTAQRFMKLARENENPTPVSLLGASKALLLLALEPVERDEFIEQKHEVDGVEKTVSEMSKRELEAAIKAKKKAEEESKSLKAQLEERRPNTMPSSGGRRTRSIPSMKRSSSSRSRRPRSSRSSTRRPSRI